MKAVERDCGPNVWGVVTSHDSFPIALGVKKKGG